MRTRTRVSCPGLGMQRCARSNTSRRTPPCLDLCGPLICARGRLLFAAALRGCSSRRPQQLEDPGLGEAAGVTHYGVEGLLDFLVCEVHDAQGAQQVCRPGVLRPG